MIAEIMIADTIRERLEAEPFRPFYVCSSSGDKHRVASPALAVLMKSEIFIAAPDSDHWVQLPYLHVAGVEAANGAGHRAKRPRKRR